MKNFWLKTKLNNPHGFGLVEIVVGVAIMSAVLLSLSQIGQFVFRVVDESNYKLRGAFLAEEGIEAVRTIRDTSWSANIAPLAPGADYYPRFSGGIWVLDPAPQPKVDGTFDRRIIFQPVNRDASDNIVSSGGILDPGTKKMTVNVAWNNRGRTNTASVSTYITDLFKN